MRACGLSVCAQARGRVRGSKYEHSRVNHKAAGSSCPRTRIATTTLMTNNITQDREHQTRNTQDTACNTKLMIPNSTHTYKRHTQLQNQHTTPPHTQNSNLHTPNALNRQSYHQPFSCVPRWRRRLGCEAVLQYLCMWRRLPYFLLVSTLKFSTLKPQPSTLNP